MAETQVTVKVEVTLVAHTCNCGTVYAVPSWITFHKCPMCATRKIDELNAELFDTRQKERRLQRTINSLRGALTRAKQR